MSLVVADVVRHPVFGLGEVKGIEPGKFVIDFETAGLKKIAAASAGLLELQPATSLSVKRELLPGMRALKKGEKYYEDFFDGCWEFWATVPREIGSQWTTL